MPEARRTSTPDVAQPTHSKLPDDTATKPQGPSQEHALGDDPNRVAQDPNGFHDSLSGRQVDEAGMFLDGSGGPIEKHRIVANNWPEVQEKIDDPAKRDLK
jgi:hypothetical protein